MLVDEQAKAQHMRALSTANGIRLHQAALKRAVRARELHVVEAIADLACARCYLLDVLTWQKQWGAARAERLLDELGIGTTKLCGLVTQRQLDLIREALR